jgi:hypothetical protein
MYTNKKTFTNVRMKNLHTRYCPHHKSHIVMWGGDGSIYNETFIFILCLSILSSSLERYMILGININHVEQYLVFSRAYC